MGKMKFYVMCVSISYTLKLRGQTFILFGRCKSSNMYLVGTVLHEYHITAEKMRKKCQPPETAGGCLWVFGIIRRSGNLSSFDKMYAMIKSK